MMAKEKGGTLRASHRSAAERIQQACPLFFAALQTRFFKGAARYRSTFKRFFNEVVASALLRLFN